MDRLTLLSELDEYRTDFPEEKPFIARFRLLLQHPDAYLRSHLPGHMTGSAWIIDESRRQVLLTHHAKLDRWLQPGGHADGDEDIVRVARREAEEETGLQSLRIIDNLFDIDVHEIPERNGFPKHLHYDVRVLLEASIRDPIVVTDESHALAWVHFDDLARRTAGNRSIERMAEKVKRLFTGQ